MQPEEFPQRIRETAAWCSAYLDSAHPGVSLRRAETKPATLPEGLVAPWKLGVDAVEQVAATRRKLLHRRGIALPASLAGGRLLVLAMDVNLSHGLADEGTGGFIDGADLPAWDAWIVEVDRFLVSWVPSTLVSSVQEFAVDFSPEGSFGWVESFQEEGWKSVWRSISRDMV